MSQLLFLNSFPRPTRSVGKAPCSYFVGRQLKSIFSSPHFGAGAGMDIEDSAVMAELQPRYSAVCNQLLLMEVA